MGFWGDDDYIEQVNNLDPHQQQLLRQLLRAAQGKGAGGAYGAAADYYYDLLSNDSETMKMLEKPEMRRFQEQILPDLAEQFAGMGAGGLSSSGFRNEAINAGTDLSERLGAMRANLRAQGAAGLSNLGAQGLTPHLETIYSQGGGGFVQNAAPIIGGALGMFGGPMTAAAMAGLASAATNWKTSSTKGTTSPYGAASSAAFQGGANIGR